MKRTVLAIKIAALFASCAMGGEEGVDWPQWRGPTRNGQFHGKAWPDSLGRLKRKWRVEIGPGYSGAIVSATSVFTVETEAKKKEVVRAFDRDSGKQIWSANWAGSMKVPWYARSNGSWTRSTPAFDGERLYVGGMLDVLVCLDAETGKEIWRVDLAKRHGRPIPQFGFVCSPLIDGEHLYVQAADGLLKIDRRDGRTLWRVFDEVEKDKSFSAFSSPVLGELNGRSQIVAQSRETLAGFDPVSGGLLWEIPVKSSHGQNILTPTLHSGGVFTSSYGGRSQLLAVMKPGDEFDVVKRWDNKLQAYMSSPVIIDGHAYLHLRNERFSCMNLKNGDIAWITREKFTDYASLVASGNRILMLDSEGTLHLIAANPKEFRRIGQRQVADAETWAHLAVVEGGLFVRELNAIAAFKWRD